MFDKLRGDVKKYQTEIKLKVVKSLLAEDGGVKLLARIQRLVGYWLKWKRHKKRLKPS